MAALQASRNAHNLPRLLRFRIACALPSGVIRGCETTPIDYRVFVTAILAASSMETVRS